MNKGVHFVDSAPLSGLQIKDSGNAHAEVLCARTGCQTYHASELGLMGDSLITVYRPEKAVMDKVKSWPTYAGKPVTIGHPTEMVTPDNWKDHAVGDIGDEIARDGEFIRVPFRLLDSAAIKAVQDGTREISMGYTTPIEMVDGVAPDGTPYQAVQTGPIVINHLALVDRARGGDKLRIGDSASKWGATPLATADMEGNNMTLQVVVLGDEAANVAVADAPKVEKFKADMAQRIADMEASHAKAIEAKDAELAKAQAAKDSAEEKIMTDAALDARVEERTALLDSVKSLGVDVETKGLSDAAIRKAVVVAKYGDSMKDKVEAYIDSRFDTLVEDAKAKDEADPFVDGLSKSIPHTDSDDNGQSNYESNMRDAWKTPATQGAA